MPNLSSLWGFIVAQILLFMLITKNTSGNSSIISFLDRAMNKLLQYVSGDLQKKISQENPRLLSQMPINIQNLMIEEDPSKLKHLDLSRQIEIVKEKLCLLKHANEDVALTVVRQNGWVLGFADGEFKNNEKVLLAATIQVFSSNSGVFPNMSEYIGSGENNAHWSRFSESDAMHPLEYASPKLQEKILLANPQLLQLLAKNVPVLKKILENNLRLLTDVPVGVQERIIYAMPSQMKRLTPAEQIKVIKEYSYLLRFSGDKIKGDKKTVLDIIIKHHSALQSEGYRSSEDKEIILFNMKQIMHASVKVQEEILLENPHLLQILADNHVALGCVLKNNLRLFTELPILKILADKLPVLDWVLKENLQIFTGLPLHMQESLVKVLPSHMRHLPPVKQRDLVFSNVKQIEYASIEVQKEMLLENPEILANNSRLLNRMLENNVQLLMILPIDKQLDFFDKYPAQMRHLTSAEQRKIIYGNLDKIDREVDERMACDNWLKPGDSKYLLAGKAELIGDGELCSWDYINDDLKDDKELIRAIVMRHLLTLEYASTRLKDDKDIVLTAVSLDGVAIEHASSRLRGDKDVALSTVKRMGCGLRSLSKDMRNNKEVVLAAINNYTLAIEYASESLRKDQEIVLAALTKDISILMPGRHGNINITVKADTSKKLISAIRENSRILDSVTQYSGKIRGIGKSYFFQGVTKATMTLQQALLRESLIAKMFFKKYNLYIKTWVFIQGWNKAPFICELSQDNINAILSFIFPKYNFEKVNIAYFPNPAKSTAVSVRRQEKNASIPCFVNNEASAPGISSLL